jgi:hypothetical protein
MLSIGGTYLEHGSLEIQDDPWPNSLGIFDMTTLNWTNTYDAAASAYERPSLVSQFYANNSRYPIEWDDPELESIFASPNGTATTNVSSGNSSNSTRPGIATNWTTNASTGSSGSNGITGGIVVGSVIGGIAALAIVASLIFWRLCRYKRKEKRSRNPVELPAGRNLAELPAGRSLAELPADNRYRQVTSRALAVGRQAYELPA